MQSFSRDLGGALELLVVLHVAAENVFAWPKHTLESLSVHLHTLDGPLGSDGGVSGVVGKECNFT